MGIFDRVEKRLERTVNSVFARAFKADVQPVEIASAIRKAMDDRAVTPSRGHVLVPNVFAVILSPSDYERLAEFEDDIIDELVVAAEEHVDTQRYSPAGPIAISLERTNDLDTGVFRIKPSKAKQVASPRAGAAGSSRSAAGGYAGVAPSAPSGRSADRPPVPSAPPARDHAADEALAGFNPYGENPYDSGRGPGGAAAAAGAAGAAVAGGAAAAGGAHADLGGSRRRPAPREEPRQVVPRRSRPGDRPYLASRDDRFLLMGAINVIGRDEENDIIFDDPGISRRHSEIRVTTDGPHLTATVRDLGSTNGTFVNGERVSNHRLEEGDRVTFGRTTVVYHAGRA
jgi:hypothetical protein